MKNPLPVSLFAELNAGLLMRDDKQNENRESFVSTVNRFWKNYFQNDFFSVTVRGFEIMRERKIETDEERVAFVAVLESLGLLD